jgi:hypothetical protein
MDRNSTLPKRPQQLLEKEGARGDVEPEQGIDDEPYHFHRQGPRRVVAALPTSARNARGHTGCSSGRALRHHSGGRDCIQSQCRAKATAAFQELLVPESRQKLAQRARSAWGSRWRWQPSGESCGWSSSASSRRTVSTRDTSPKQSVTLTSRRILTPCVVLCAWGPGPSTACPFLQPDPWVSWFLFSLL